MHFGCLGLLLGLLKKGKNFSITFLNYQLFSYAITNISEKAGWLACLQGLTSQCQNDSRPQIYQIPEFVSY